MSYFLKQFAEKPSSEPLSPSLVGTMTSTRTIEGVDQDNFKYSFLEEKNEPFLVATMTITSTPEGNDQDRQQRDIFCE